MHSDGCYPYCKRLSLSPYLSLSPKAAGSNANSDGCILNLLMFTLPCELELAWHLKDAPVFVRICSAHLFLFIFFLFLKMAPTCEGWISRRKAVTVGCLQSPPYLKKRVPSQLVQCIFALVIFEPANKWLCDFYRHHIAPSEGFLSGNGGGSLGLCSSSYQIYSSSSGILLTDIFWIRHLQKMLGESLVA